MSRNNTPSFVLEQKLACSPEDDAFLNDVFFRAFLMQNRLIRHAQACLRHLRQDSEYRELMEKRRPYAEKQASGKALSKPEKDELTDINNALKAVRERCGLSEALFQNWLIPQQHRYKRWVDSNTSQKIATRVWQAVSEYIFRKGNSLHFVKLMSFKSVEGKNNTAGIRYRHGWLEFQKHSIAAPIDYGDDYAVEALGHRVKYCRIVRKPMGIRWHYYLQLVLEGYPPRKREYTDGDVGIDPGVSCETAVSDKGMLMREITPSARHADEIKRLQRKLDASRRANNPDNYNEDGTVKERKQRKPWVYTKSYRRNRMRLKTLYRRNTKTLEQTETMMVNEILTGHGCDVFTEKMNYKALAARAKETKVDEATGRCRSKKRFGSSIAGHAPSRFLNILERKLGYVGKMLNYVDTAKFRASQYDHSTGTYTKAELDQRWKIVGGYVVQRDLYSGFLLKNALDPEHTDRDRCTREFEDFVCMQNDYIASLMNQGISKPSVFGF